MTGTYEDIARPVLQVHGGRDASISVDAARGLTSRLADARFVLVEGASHDVHIDAPDALVAAIVAFERESPVASAFGGETPVGVTDGR